MSPERRIDPPVKHYRIGVCPECGDQNILVRAMQSVTQEILSWDGNSPDKLGEIYVELAFPAAYECGACGKKFFVPDFVIVKD
jgi:predicted RNA-binding Zn-ribbon protein involved in translation (DUF1610 family)